ncbi:SixA Phosphohistidine phosphatase SixA [Candidatus Pelagibacterales bacterium]
MLNLYVMRHAKSSWKNKSLQDFERPLSNKGKAEIKFISKFLKKKKIKFDLACVSSAKRTMQTYKKLIKKIKISKAIFSKKLYLTDLNVIINFIKETKLKYKNIILINHEPACKELVTKLIKKKYIKFKKKPFETSGVAKISFKKNKWKQIQYYSGNLVFFKIPSN